MNPIRAGYFFYELYIFARATIMDDTNQAMMVAILVILIFVVAWYIYRRAAAQRNPGPPDANPEAVGSCERFETQTLLAGFEDINKFSECASYPASPASPDSLWTDDREYSHVDLAADQAHFMCNKSMKACSSPGVGNQATCSSAVEACMPAYSAYTNAVTVQTETDRPPLNDLPTNQRKRWVALKSIADDVNNIAPHVPQCIKALREFSPEAFANFAKATKDQEIDWGLPTKRALDLLRNEDYIENVKNAIATAPGLALWSNKLFNLFDIRD
jgi:hypothetical protein